MINVVIPIASKKLTDENDIFQYPLPLIEILGKTLIEYSLDGLKSLKEKINFIFILKEDDCNRYHFDNSLYLLIPDCTIVRLKETTQGAICSVLMTIDLLDKDAELIIVNYDQYIDHDLDIIIKYFRQENADGGLITFKSIHPRWSYAKVVGDNIIQTAEKNPISNFAIAGFYYYRKANYFIEAAYNVIRFDENYNDKFYTSSTFNQMILNNLIIKNYTIKNEDYHSFYSPQKVNEFRAFLNIRHNGNL